MNELVPAFENSLFETSIIDIGIDYLELGIDSVLQDGLLKDIPIVGTFIGVGKFAQNIHDRNLLKQTLIFINECNSGIISEEKKKAHREKLIQNPKLMENELGRVLVLLDKNIESIKSVFEAKFYAAYVNGTILWNDFCELCDITSRLFVSDIDCLKEAYNNDGIEIRMPVTYRHDRLISVGLLTNEARLSGSAVFVDFDSDKRQNLMELTEIGKKFCKMVFA